MVHTRNILWLLTLIPFTAGCAAYQHRLVEPTELADIIDREAVMFTIDPLQYVARTEHGRLLLRISNPTNDSIILLGEQSFLIDPAGETRSVSGGAIAPGSYISLMIPPQVETVRAGPRFGMGVGVGTGIRTTRFGVGAYHDPGRHSPAYSRATVPVWNWVTGNVRMRVVYERDGDRFSHDLEFAREKVK